MLRPVAGEGRLQRIRLRTVAEVPDRQREQELFAQSSQGPAVQMSVFGSPQANAAEALDGIDPPLKPLGRCDLIPEGIRYPWVRKPDFLIRGAIDPVAPSIEQLRVTATGDHRSIGILGRKARGIAPGRRRGPTARRGHHTGPEGHEIGSES